MNDEKRRGRPPKQGEVSESIPDTPTQTRDMTFDEVMAWNRANTDKLPPIQAQKPERPPLTRF